MSRYILLLIFVVWRLGAFGHTPSVWVSDLGNGSYRNPVINADYSDPDVCRVGDDYFMTASSFNCVPALPILHSKDLVNWQLVNYAIKRLTPCDLFSRPQHGNGVWAPSIRFYGGEYFIFYGDPDQGIFMTKTDNPLHEWSLPVLVKPGRGLIDPCPLWDEGGQAFLVHAYAGSRAGFKSVLAVAPLSADGTCVMDESRIVYDGNLNDPTIEGPKFYKHDGKYCIFAPAGGVSTGWQLVLISDSPYGPYRRKVVMAEGRSGMNGPHQGAWVDTPSGENWFFHFQDKGALGRVVHLQPMVWHGDFPVIGTDPDGDGVGEPVWRYRKPDVGAVYPVQGPVQSDEFNDPQIGLQWQWQANPSALWSFSHVAIGCLRLYSVPQTDDYTSLWSLPNLLLQKFPNDTFTATTKLTFSANAHNLNERAGLVVIGLDYGVVYLEQTPQGITISQSVCMNADRAGKEKVCESRKIVATGPVFLRVRVGKENICTFYISTDGEHFTAFGTPFTAREGKWIGAKVGLFCQRPVVTNSAGWVDVDWFRITKNN